MTFLGRRSAILWIAVIPLLASPCHGQGFDVLTLTGPVPPTGFGRSVDLIDDLDADFKPDIVVGANMAQVGGAASAGRVFVFSSSGAAVILEGAGTVFGESLGVSVARAGDVNSDGLEDLIGGATGGGTFAGTGSAYGQAKVFSGADGSILHTFDGPGPSSWFGFSVAGAGDVNGDGQDDVVVGAPFYHVGITQPGQARVFSGSDGAVLHTFTGPGSYDKAGTAVAGAGDVNGDGHADILVGNPDAQFTVSSSGRFLVYSGADGSILFDVWGTEPFGKLGTSVAPAGDANGDGVEDFVAGSPNVSYGSVFDAGQAKIYSGVDASVLQTLDGTLAFECMGRSVARAGDMDGDGFEDVVVGSAYCYPGGIVNQPGRAFVFSGFDGSMLFSLSGPHNGASFGFSVAGGEDVSTDGVPDLLVGSPTTIVAGSVVGQARVISLVGVPAGVAEVGSGCAGTGGFAPKMATHGGLPAVGNGKFGFSVARGLGGTLAGLFASTAVDPAGIPVAGCSVHLTGAVLWIGPLVTLGGAPGTPGGGHRLVKIGIPADPVLVGGVVHFQWAVLDTGSANGLLVTSNALSVTIQ